jgi:hypothetical protein
VRCISYIDVYASCGSMRQTGLQSAQKKLHSSQNRTEQNRTEQNRTEQNRARDKVKIQVSTDFVTTFGPGVKNIKHGDSILTYPSRGD